ncbi:MAG TPA: DUF2877 domain-containing protein [bacterium]|nr:DUF2877 domain-containing protein [bacterium]
MIRCANELKNIVAVGKIHSIFDNAINLLYDDDRLIAILKNKTILLPYSIILDIRKFEKLKNTVQLNDNYILKDNKLKISNVEITLENFNENNNTKIDYSDLKKIYDITADLFVEYKKNCFEIFATENYDDLIELLLDKYYKNNLIDFLIGRGFGLTPSGDDILNGLIYIQKNSAYKNCNIINLEKLVKVLKKTTIFSQNMLNYAIENKYNELFNYIILNVNNKNLVSGILKLYGASSGFDTLLGLSLGKMIIIRHYNFIKTEKIKKTIKDNDLKNKEMIKNNKLKLDKFQKKS